MPWQVDVEDQRDFNSWYLSSRPEYWGSYPVYWKFAPVLQPRLVIAFEHPKAFVDAVISVHAVAPGRHDNGFWIAVNFGKPDVSLNLADQLVTCSLDAHHFLSSCEFPFANIFHPKFYGPFGRTFTFPSFNLSIDHSFVGKLGTIFLYHSASQTVAIENATGQGEWTQTQYFHLPSPASVELEVSMTIREWNDFQPHSQIYSGHRNVTLSANDLPYDRVLSPPFCHFGDNFQEAVFQKIKGSGYVYVAKSNHSSVGALLSPNTITCPFPLFPLPPSGKLPASLRVSVDSGLSWSARALFTVLGPPTKLCLLSGSAFLLAKANTSITFSTVVYIGDLDCHNDTEADQSWVDAVKPFSMASSTVTNQSGEVISKTTMDLVEG